MASSLRFQALATSITALLVLALSTTPTDSACASQKFNNSKVFQSCSDLSTLSASLHWNYTSSNDSLSVAFVADPMSRSGWIAWGINPTGTGMLGAQTLVAFRENGSVVLKQYNLTSYASITQRNLSFKVSGLSTEVDSGGVMSLFATINLPATLGTSLNQVWQVGGSVVDGVPQRHALADANKNAKGTLDLKSSEKTAGAKSGGEMSAGKMSMGFVLSLLLGSFVFVCC